MMPLDLVKKGQGQKERGQVASWLSADGVGLDSGHR